MFSYCYVCVFLLLYCFIIIMVSFVMFVYSFCYVCPVLGILVHCVVLCVVCV
jgi:hypothetical protein